MDDGMECFMPANPRTINYSPQYAMIALYTPMVFAPGQISGAPDALRMS